MGTAKQQRQNGNGMVETSHKTDAKLVSAEMLQCHKKTDIVNGVTD